MILSKFNSNYKSLNDTCILITKMMYQFKLMTTILESCVIPIKPDMYLSRILHTQKKL